MHCVNHTFTVRQSGEWWARDAVSKTGHNQHASQCMCIGCECTHTREEDSDTMDMLQNMMAGLLHTPPREMRVQAVPGAPQRNRVDRSPGRVMDRSRRARYRDATAARARQAEGAAARQRVERGGGARRRVLAHPNSLFGLRMAQTHVGEGENAGALLNDMGAYMAWEPPVPVARRLYGGARARENEAAKAELEAGLVVATGQAHCDGQCAICQEPTVAGEGNTITLPCGHVFHAECIRRWFDQGRSVRSCPECRADAEPELRRWGRVGCVCAEGREEPGLPAALTRGPAGVAYVTLEDGSVMVD